jgi:hypothetical protein
VRDENTYIMVDPRPSCRGQRVRRAKYMEGRVDWHNAWSRKTEGHRHSERAVGAAQRSTASERRAAHRPPLLPFIVCFDWRAAGAVVRAA